MATSPHPIAAALRRFRAGAPASATGPSVIRAAVTLLMFVIGAYGFAAIYHPHDFDTWSDTLFRTAQLITGQFPQELLPAPGAPRIPVPLSLEIARFALPLLVLWLALSGLVRRIRAPFRTAGAAMLSDHLVLAGAGRAVAALLAEARAERRRTVVIAAPASGLAEEEIAGAVAIVGDPGLADTWRHIGLARAATVAVVGLEDADALAATLAAAAVAREERPTGAPPLALVAAIEDADLRALLDDLFRGRDPAEGLVLSATSSARLRARALLARHPLHRGVDVAAGEAVHALVIGFGRTGEEIAVEVLKTGVVAEDNLPRVTVVDPDAARLGRSFRERYRRAAPLDRVTFVPEAVDPGDADALSALCERTGPVGAVYLCLPDDTRGLLTAIALRRVAAAAGRGAPPVYLRRRGGADLGAALAEASLGAVDLTRIHAFGHDDARSLDALTGATLDRRARRIHEHYLAQLPPASGTAAAPAQRPWPLLGELYRQASRDQADYLPMRLAALGIAAVPAGEAEPLGDAVIEAGARAEHARWMVAASLAGWREGKRDNEALNHPDLVAYDGLNAAARDKDRAVVRRLDAELDDGRGTAPLRLARVADLAAPLAAATLVEAGLDTPEEARALRAAAAAHPGLRWRLRLDANLPARLRRWPDARARADARWAIEGAEQVLWRGAASPVA